MVPFSERLFMNRKIKAYQAIIYIVLFYLAAVLFLLGPGKLLEKDRLLAGAENPVGTVEVREDQQVQQVLIAKGHEEKPKHCIEYRSREHSPQQAPPTKRGCQYRPLKHPNH